MANKNELINVNSLICEIDEYIQENREQEYCANNFCADVAEVIKNCIVKEMTIVDAVEVVHGRWLAEKCNHKPYRIKNPEKWVIHKCSQCGYGNGRKQSNYCPNCGAKMDG